MVVPGALLMLSLPVGILGGLSYESCPHLRAKSQTTSILDGQPHNPSVKMGSK